MRTLLLTLLIALAVGAAYAEADSDVWSGFGLFTVTPEAPVPAGFAQGITETLLPASSWKAQGLPYTDSENAKAYLIDYGEKGKLITVDRWLNLNPNVRFSLNIGRPAALPIRHKIMIGTDKADWEIIKRSPPSSGDELFHRAYLLRRGENGAVLGIVFHGGAWSTIEWPAPSTTSQVDSLVILTHALSEELRRVYPDRIAPLAEALNDESPVPQRPDLPDPDAQPRVINADEFAG